MLIGKKDQDVIKERFAGLDKKVQLIFFESSLDCEYCPQTKQLVTELAELSDKLEVQVHNLHTEPDVAASYHVSRVPALILLDDTGKDYGIKFYGIPAGYEFSTLLEDILMVSTGETSLSKNAVETLQNLTQDVHLQVFVTPT